MRNTLKMGNVISRSVLVIIGLAVITGAFALHVVHRFEFFGGCQDTLLAKTPATHKNLTASVYERDCGATTPLARFVAIEKSRFLALNNAEEVFLIKGQDAIFLKWRNEFELEITHNSSDTDIFNRRANYEGVKISYKRGGA